MIDNVVKKSAFYLKNDLKREYSCLEYRPQVRTFKFEYHALNEHNAKLIRTDGRYKFYSETISIKLPFLQLWKVKRSIGEQMPPLAVTCTKEAFTEESFFYQPAFPNWVNWCRPCVGQTSANASWTYEEAIKLFWNGINVCSEDYMIAVRNDSLNHFYNGDNNLNTTLKQFYYQEQYD